MLFTLCSHEVGKVPDEFTNHILPPLLVQSVVVTPQHHILVILSEHHGWILGRRRHQHVSRLQSQSLRTSGNLRLHVCESSRCEILPLHLLHTRSGWWVSCTLRTSSRTGCWAGWGWPLGGLNHGTRRSNCSRRLHPHREPRTRPKTRIRVSLFHSFTNEQ